MYPVSRLPQMVGFSKRPDGRSARISRSGPIPRKGMEIPTHAAPVAAPRQESARPPTPQSEIRVLFPDSDIPRVWPPSLLPSVGDRSCTESDCQRHLQHTRKKPKNYEYAKNDYCSQYQHLDRSITNTVRRGSSPRWRRFSNKASNLGTNPTGVANNTTPAMQWTSSMSQNVVLERALSLIVEPPSVLCHSKRACGSPPHQRP